MLDAYPGSELNGGTDPSKLGSTEAFWTVEQLIRYGITRPQFFADRRLEAGEGKKKIALLCFSSGTTGKPKVRDGIPPARLV